MAAKNKPTPPAFGAGVLDGALLDTLERLWEGPVRLSDLDQIEIALRALLVSPSLISLRHLKAWDVSPSLDAPGINYQEPFDDHLLDYEFHDPSVPLELPSLLVSEKSSLASRVSSELAAQGMAALPKWVNNAAQAGAFLDAWYDGHSPDECEVAAREMRDWEDNAQDSVADLQHFVTFAGGPLHHVEELVACHRAGYTVYGFRPVFKFCEEHVFSHWPKELFSSLDSEYRAMVRSLRGPGIAVELPPILAIILSRAKYRAEIPDAIRDLRAEYRTARDKLWKLLNEMWSEPTLKQQVRILQDLKSASQSIFGTAFPERFDALSFGLSLSQLSPGGIASAAKQLRERDRPNARVQAVSFAYKLSQDLRHSVLNSRTVLKRHFTEAELSDFGIAT
jgi:hypothetical protein